MTLLSQIEKNGSRVSLEEVSLLNIDFEKNLFSDFNYIPRSNKLTQEFEYLLSIIENTTLLSSKSYSKQFCQFIEALSGHELRTVNSAKDVKLWWGDFSSKGIKRKLQSKIETGRFAIAQGLAHPETCIIDRVSEIKSEYLCKSPYEMSGRGVIRPPLPMERIEKLINLSSLIQEPLLERVDDFGTLIQNGKILCVYRNCVDEKFQYKGTIISTDVPSFFNHPDVKRGEKLVLQYIQEADYDGICSIDSFSYKRGREEVIYYLSEINARKSMGYFAHLLREKLFKEAEVFKFGIFSGKAKVHMSLEAMNELFEKKAYILSPEGNRFHTYIIGADSEHELEELENRILKLLST